jgi:hypothetical protein
MGLFDSKVMCYSPLVEPLGKETAHEKNNRYSNAAFFRHVRLCAKKY